MPNNNKYFLIPCFLMAKLVYFIEKAKVNSSFPFFIAIFASIIYENIH
ncbi:hypothetical protein HMPREF3202_00711 [Prevotella bivia]|uniref:Uncharacterized protein n=1 Tax=Prevotella bivia TaxID=28125 RepID=A0A137SZZ3_9BACT|nr:hypothetical protein HMPREF3202_00711 [Prevotella bivia]